MKIKLFITSFTLVLFLAFFLMALPAMANVNEDDDGGCGDEPNCEDVVVEETKSDKKTFDASDDDFKNKNTDLPHDFKLTAPGGPRPDVPVPGGEPEPEDDDGEDDPCAEAMAKVEEVREKIREAKAKGMADARELFGTDMDVSNLKGGRIPFIGFYEAGPTSFDLSSVNIGMSVDAEGNTTSESYVTPYQDSIDTLFRELGAALQAAAEACGGDGMMAPLRDDQKEE